MKVNIYQEHDLDVQTIREQLYQAMKSASKITLGEQKASNTTRSSPYKKGKLHLNIHKLNRILEINTQKCTAIVEPRVTMEALVEATLQKGLVPAVLPEFKGITVGGAIMGTALESSSHLYGQFNDNCLAYDVLLGDGSLLHATPHENADLFYGLSGSYGTLGLILKIELKLIPAKNFVRLNYQLFKTVQEAIQMMNEANKFENPPDFLEGIAFNKDNVIVIEGRFADKEDVRDLQKIALDKSWSPWYYQHLAEIKGPHQDYMSTKDYLFRLDRGAFWMASYVLHGPLLWQFIQQTFFRRSAKDITLMEREKYSQLRFPNFLQRLALGWGMTTQWLYPLLHGNREGWFEKRFVIQDYYIPHKNVPQFTEQVFSELGINPIWLCPMKSTSSPQILSPHYHSKANGELMYDVGVYGMPKGEKDLLQINRDLEQWTLQAGGRKMLYSSVFYSPDEFWNIYPKQEYEQLRERYHAQNAWLSITEKLLQN